MSTPDLIDGELESLRARNSELEARIRLLEVPATNPVPGNRVVLGLFGLIMLSTVVAFTLWTAGKRTARERAQNQEHAPAVTRIDLLGRAAVSGVQRCAAAAQLDEGVDAELRLKLTPTGSVTLIEAVVRPDRPDFVPCVRKVSQGIQLDADASAGVSSPDVKVLYRVDRPTADGPIEARWSWRLLP
jgi:hypothetical protein